MQCCTPIYHCTSQNWPQLIVQTRMHCIHRLQTNCDAPIINVLWWTTALVSVGSAISYHCAANPNSHCIWGRGGSCVGEKGPQRIKEFKRNCPTCPNCPTLSKCRTQSELISSLKDKRKKKDRLRKEVGALCKWRVFKEQKGVKRNYPTKLPHTTVKVENTHDELSILTIWPSCVCFVDALDDDVA